MTHILAEKEPLCGGAVDAISLLFFNLYLIIISCPVRTKRNTYLMTQGLV